MKTPSLPPSTLVPRTRRTADEDGHLRRREGEQLGLVDQQCLGGDGVPCP